MDPVAYHKSKLMQDTARLKALLAPFLENPTGIGGRFAVPVYAEQLINGMVPDDMLKSTDYDPASMTYWTKMEITVGDLLQALIASRDQVEQMKTQWVEQQKWQSSVLVQQSPHVARKVNVPVVREKRMSLDFD